MLSRRNFLKLFAAATVVPLIPGAVETEIIGEAEYGFTWGNVQSSSPAFSALIKDTLRTRSKELAEGLSNSNALLLKLNDNKAIRINKISVEEQMERMKKKYIQLAFEKHKKRYPTAHKYLVSGEYDKQQNIPDYYIEYDEEPGSRKKHSETIEDRWYK